MLVETKREEKSREYAGIVCMRAARHKAKASGSANRDTKRRCPGKGQDDKRLVSLSHREEGGYGWKQRGEQRKKAQRAGAAI